MTLEAHEFIRWACRKFKRMRHQSKGVKDWLVRVRRATPRLLAHWALCNGRTSGAVTHELPDRGRLGSPLIRMDSIITTGTVFHAGLNAGMTADNLTHTYLLTSSGFYSLGDVYGGEVAYGMTQYPYSTKQSDQSLVM
jgi:hypothetical protein